MKVKRGHVDSENVHNINGGYHAVSAFLSDDARLGPMEPNANRSAGGGITSRNRVRYVPRTQKDVRKRASEGGSK
jgi:hypothetical protein